jgi:hypothetical protein
MREKIKRTVKRITILFLFSITSMYITKSIYEFTHVIYFNYAYYAFSLMTAFLLAPITFTIFALISDNE